MEILMFIIPTIVAFGMYYWVYYSDSRAEQREKERMEVEMRNQAIIDFVVEDIPDASKYIAKKTMNTSKIIKAKIDQKTNDFKDDMVKRIARKMEQ